MHYAIVDREGSNIETFSTEEVARSALRAMVEVQPPLADELLLLAYGTDGQPMGEAVMVTDLRAAGALIRIRPSSESSFAFLVSAGTIPASVAPGYLLSETRWSVPAALKGRLTWSSDRPEALAAG